MVAYLTTTITLKDMTKMQEYGAKAQPILAAHGGEPVVMGRVSSILCGAAGHQMEVVFRFPDAAAIETWYNSPDYQALVPLRDEAADVVFKIVEPL